MSLAHETTLRIVLYEGVGAAEIGPEERFRIMAGLLEKGYAVTGTGGASGADRAELARSDRGGLLVLGRFDGGRAPSGDGEGNGEAEGARVTVRYRDLGGAGVGDVEGWAEEARQEVKAARPGDWKPWFPVIDYDRCTNCMQCLSFCLFDVYGVDTEQRIQVQNNDNCKTNCPACSRVCPEAAIMFPKYKAGPINGDEVSQSDLNREKMKVDISSLLGGDVYAMLRERSAKAKSRFSKERDSDKALNERQKCLTKLAQSGDIPADVLMSLPSPDEIQRRAEAAKAKAQAALDGRGGG